MRLYCIAAAAIQISLSGIVVDSSATLFDHLSHFIQIFREKIQVLDQGDKLLAGHPFTFRIGFSFERDR